MAEINNNIIAEKLKIAMIKNNIPTSHIAKTMECSVSNISNKFKRNNFNESDFRQIADALGCDVEINLISRESGEKF